MWYVVSALHRVSIVVGNQVSNHIQTYSTRVHG